MKNKVYLLVVCTTLKLWDFDCKLSKIIWNLVVCIFFFYHFIKTRRYKFKVDFIFFINPQIRVLNLNRSILIKWQKYVDYKIIHNLEPKSSFFKRSDIYTTNFRQFLWQPLLFSSYWINIIERERRSERIKTHVSMRENVILKIVKKWSYKYHFSF